LVGEHFGPDGRAAYDAAKSDYLRREVALDDILDAFACLWTAERIDGGRARRVLDRPEIDPLGIPMQMVC
jgi:predicted RNase H-like nuclease